MWIDCPLALRSFLSSQLSAFLFDSISISSRSLQTSTSAREARARAITSAATRRAVFGARVGPASSSTPTTPPATVFPLSSARAPLALFHFLFPPVLLRMPPPPVNHSTYYTLLFVEYCVSTREFRERRRSALSELLCRCVAPVISCARAQRRVRWRCT